MVGARRMVWDFTTSQGTSPSGSGSTGGDRLTQIIRVATVRASKVKLSAVKDLRRDAGRLLDEGDAGERFVITKRGAILSPVAAADAERQPVGPLAKAWAQLESALARSDPAYGTVEEALDHFRLRPR